MTALVLDAGSLIAVERGDHRISELIGAALDDERRVYVPATVLAQVWRGRRQARVALALRSVETLVLDDDAARDGGALLATSGTSDISDAHVALVALAHRGVVATSDPDDLVHLGVPRARLLIV